MLYDRWRTIAREWKSEVALRDLAAGRSWTFAQLAAEAERRPTDATSVVFSRGTGPEFIFSVLCGWRDKKVVCPIEAGQEEPTIPPSALRWAHLKMTSATTGPARLIAFTAEQLAADPENIVRTKGLRPGWPNLGVISLAHSYGFSNLVLPLLLHGIPLALLPSPLPEGMRMASQEMGAMTLAAVPALWRTWHETGTIPANVRLAISAGAPLPLELEKEIFSKRNLKIHNFYGSSECGGIAYDRSEVPREDAGDAGTAMEGVSLSVSAEGCLEVKSRAVGETYLPDAAEALGGGRYKTSDLVELTRGHVFLRGRAGDLINVAGRKISPETIEQHLRTHPAIRECVVFGAPSTDAGRAETIVACVEQRSSVTVDELRQFLLARLPAWQIPREWFFVESIAANQRGKLSRAEWRRRFLNQPETLSAPGRS